MEAFLKRFGPGPRRGPQGARIVRCWLGARPDVRAGALPRAVAAMIGYPASPDGWPEGKSLESIGRHKAGPLLAFVATRSLLHGGGAPRKSYVTLAVQALAEFDDGAIFLTNTPGWLTSGAFGWSVQLTDAVLEAGLIAYDATHAMIFWVGESD